MDEDCFQIARICREALNAAIYDGLVPHDSNALSEVWPTMTGAACGVQHHGRRLAVVAAPAEALAGFTLPHCPEVT